MAGGIYKKFESWKLSIDHPKWCYRQLSGRNRSKKGWEKCLNSLTFIEISQNPLLRPEDNFYLSKEHIYLMPSCNLQPGLSSGLGIIWYDRKYFIEIHILVTKMTDELRLADISLILKIKVIPIIHWLCRHIRVRKLIGSVCLLVCLLVCQSVCRFWG